MSFNQLKKSFIRIIRNKTVNRPLAIVKHLMWQLRKIFKLFPFKQKISNSEIIAKHAKCGVSALINSQGLYDYNNMRFVMFLMQNFRNKSFFDIGANIGSYTLIASEGNQNQVVAFEPHPVTFQYLQENVSLNKRKNIKLINSAVGQTTGKVFFTNDPGSAINHIQSQKLQNNIEVEAVNISDFCAKYQLMPNFVKIDIEGFEYHCLLGFKNYIKKVDVMIIEISNKSEKNVANSKNKTLDLMQKYNFIGPLQYNFIEKSFKPKEEKTIEDDIFISTFFLEALKKNGISFKY